MTHTWKQLAKHRSLYVMLVPVFVYFVLFAYYPLARGFAISLQEFRLIGNRPFVGLNNYVAVLRDPLFWQVLRNTLVIGGGILGIGFVVPIFVALSLSEVARVFFRKFIQMVIYLPHLFSWVVVGGIWIYLLSPDGGLVNELIKLVGGQPIHFLARDTYARPVMIMTPIWKDMGFSAILYLAAIVGINPALYEAARIDGANRWQQTRFVTLPLLRSTMKVVLLLNMAGMLRIFDQIYVMRNGAIARQVDVLMTYVYDKGLLQFRMGFATAAAFLVIVATLIIVTIGRWVMRFDVEE